MRRVALLLAAVLAAAAPAAAKIILLDNFDAGEFKNMLQGQTGPGTWTRTTRA